MQTSFTELDLSANSPGPRFGTDRSCMKGDSTRELEDYLASIKEEIQIPETPFSRMCYRSLLCISQPKESQEELDFHAMFQQNESQFERDMRIRQLMGVGNSTHADFRPKYEPIDSLQGVIGAEECRSNDAEKTPSNDHFVHDNMLVLPGILSYDEFLRSLSTDTEVLPDTDDIYNTARTLPDKPRQHSVRALKSLSAMQVALCDTAEPWEREDASAEERLIAAESALPVLRAECAQLRALLARCRST